MAKRRNKRRKKQPAAPRARRSRPRKSPSSQKRSSEKRSSSKKTGLADRRGAPRSIAALERELEAMRQQLSEVLEQQAATTVVLRAVSTSSGELKAVFDTMLENATRI